METQIKVTPISIISKGDESVGMFSAQWQINEEIYIEKEDINSFREELRTVFANYVADDCRVEFASDPKPVWEGEFQSEHRQLTIPDVSGRSEQICPECNGERHIKHYNSPEYGEACDCDIKTCETCKGKGRICR